MDLINCGKLTKDQFVERFFNEMDASMDEIDDNEVEDIESSVNNNATNVCENEEIELPKTSKVKRRSNLTTFGPSQSAKRKNESAKRELTSIVRQVCTILQIFLFTNPQIVITDKKFVYFCSSTRSINN